MTTATKTKRAYKRRATTTPVAVEDGIELPYECDWCDRKCATKQGLAIHKGRDHKPAPAAPASNGTGPLQLCCDDCEASFPTDEMRHHGLHVQGVHHRAPTAAETTPRRREHAA